VPAFQGSSFRTGESHACLFADIKNQKLAVSATVEGLGSALLLSRQVEEPEGSKKTEGDKTESDKTEDDEKASRQRQKGR
jgi:hypothetical protein